MSVLARKPCRDKRREDYRLAVREAEHQQMRVIAAMSRLRRKHALDKAIKER